MLHLWNLPCQRISWRLRVNLYLQRHQVRREYHPLFRADANCGNSTAGLCPGPANIQCCTSSGSGNSCPPALNSASISLIKLSEGFSGSPYIDAAKNPTVGYGHLCSTKGCTELGYDYPISETEGQALLQKDLKTYEKCLDAAVKVKLNANQYGALTSWTFNMGCGAMQGSTLVKRLNEGDSPNTVAAEELPKWVRGGGHTLPGLVKRRAAEVELFRMETSVGAIPC